MNRTERLRVVLRLAALLRVAESRRDLVASIVLRQRIKAATR